MMALSRSPHLQRLFFVAFVISAIAPALHYVEPHSRFGVGSITGQINNFSAKFGNMLAIKNVVVSRLGCNIEMPATILDKRKVRSRYIAHATDAILLWPEQSFQDSVTAVIYSHWVSRYRRLRPMAVDVYRQINALGIPIVLPIDSEASIERAIYNSSGSASDLARKDKRALSSAEGFFGFLQCTPLQNANANQTQRERGYAYVGPYRRITPPLALFSLSIVLVAAGVVHIHRLCDEDADEQQTGDAPEWRQVSVAAALFFGGWMLGVYSTTLLLPAIFNLASLDRRSEDIGVLPVVVTELKYRDIERQIFLADLVEASHDAALHERPEAFDGLSMDRADNILPACMVTLRSGYSAASFR